MKNNYNKIVIIIVFIVLSLLLVFASGLAYYFYSISIESQEDYVYLEPTIEEAIDAKEDSKIFVEIKGDVVNPGVYEAEENSIINDCILAAGGFNSTAYTDNINLAKKVSDELVIYVFTKSEYKKKDNANTTTASCSSSNYQIDACTNSYSSIIISGSSKTETSNTTSVDNTSNSLININTATLDQLTTLPGIGESKAQTIITYRNENGLFKSIEEIKNVSGIGDSTYEKFKDYITV